MPSVAFGCGQITTYTRRTVYYRWSLDVTIPPKTIIYRCLLSIVCIAQVWLYVFISSVIMVNLLVAMFADTYVGVKESADYEAQAARYRKIFELRRRCAISYFTLYTLCRLRGASRPLP